MPDYSNDSYLQSLNQSRADVDRQVTNTLNEVLRQRDVAFGQTDRIMPAVNTVYTQGRQAQQQDLGAINRAIGFQGVSGEAGLARLGTQEQAFGQAVPLYRQGFEEQATQRTGAVNNIGQQLRSDVDQRQAQYVAQREAEDRQRAFEQEQQAAQMAQAQRIAQQQAGAQQAALSEAARQADLQRLWESGQAEDKRLFYALLNSPPGTQLNDILGLPPMQQFDNRPIRGVF